MFLLQHDLVVMGWQEHAIGSGITACCSNNNCRDTRQSYSVAVLVVIVCPVSTFVTVYNGARGLIQKV